MLNLKKLQSLKIKKFSTKLLLLIILPSLIFSSTTLSQENHPCKRAGINLRGDLETIMNRGGLWSLMEQTEGLQDKSVLGLQIDGKLARLVGQFETICEEGEKKPTKQLFTSITNLLGEARVVWNPRSSGEAIVKLLNALNKKLDTLLLTVK
jgi:hypothetical protein